MKLGTVLSIMLLIDASFLIIGSIGRVLIQVTSSQPLDAIPFIGCTLGFVSLGLLFISIPVARKVASE